MHATRRTINSTRTLLGDYASSSDHVVIYGINLYYDHDLKMLSRPEPEYSTGGYGGIGVYRDKALEVYVPDHGLLTF